MNNEKTHLIAGIQPNKDKIFFIFNGELISAWKGESLASALLRAGHTKLRKTRLRHDDRSYFCGMGLCWDCAVTIAGVGTVRSCMFPVSHDMIVTPADAEIKK